MILAEVAWSVWLVLLLLYMLPTVIGWQRKVTSLGSVVVVNVFLGWTFIGWVVALAMAMRSRPVPADTGTR